MRASRVLVEQCQKLILDRKDRKNSTIRHEHLHVSACGRRRYFSYFLRSGRDRTAGLEGETCGGTEVLQVPTDCVHGSHRCGVGGNLRVLLFRPALNASERRA